MVSFSGNSARKDYFFLPFFFVAFFFVVLAFFTTFFFAILISPSFLFLYFIRKSLIFGNIQFSCFRPDLFLIKLFLLNNFIYINYIAYYFICNSNFPKLWITFFLHKRYYIQAWLIFQENCKGIMFIIFNFQFTIFKQWLIFQFTIFIRREVFINLVIGNSLKIEN